MKLLVESQYFPPVTLFRMSIRFSNVNFDIYEPWRKMSFRNRCVVVGSNGPINLSIPVVEGREQKKLMKEVMIDNQKPWQSQHFKTITSCYNRSPWFSFFEPELDALYRQPVDRLSDWNRICFEWVTKKLGVAIYVDYSQYVPGKNGQGEVVDWRNKLTPKSIKNEFPDPVKYHQVFEDRIGFIPNLSVLDLLFCEGKNAGRILSAGA
ncbi:MULTISPECIES: WbqC family protein [Niastella]|uniref:WbqC family protein n=1 Tax=Niastella soli TaxID=2821487 RepID=A0ABS3YXM8_9BACT|nr:WbqC family protein [Niastella soli]MBO9202679.1 WbqC family protein [Niastella soli]